MFGSFTALIVAIKLLRCMIEKLLQLKIRRIIWVYLTFFVELALKKLIYVLFSCFFRNFEKGYYVENTEYHFTCQRVLLYFDVFLGKLSPPPPLPRLVYWIFKLCDTFISEYEMTFCVVFFLNVLEFSCFLILTPLTPGVHQKVIHAFRYRFV